MKFTIHKTLLVVGWLVIFLASLSVDINAQTPIPFQEAGSLLPAEGSTKDPNEYNYLPLSFHGNSFEILTDGMVRDQGYEPKCALPQWKISPQLLGEYRRYFELFPSAVLEADGNPDSYEIRLTDSIVPMLRGNEDHKLTNKISSLEGFFGATNPLLPSEEPNSSGVIQNLTTLGQQCQIKMDNFAAIDRICSKLADSSGCYMDREIPGTTIKILDLYDRLVEYKEKYLATMAEKNRVLTEAGQQPLAVSFCDDFTDTSKDNQNLFGATKADRLKYATAVLYAPLDIDTLYRIAFLIIAPTQNIQEGADDIFWFLHNPENINDEDIKPPIIAAFRIPDFGTNKPLSLKPIRDSSQVTRRVLTPGDVLETQDKIDLSRRSSKASKVLAAEGNYLTNPNSLIYCPDILDCKPPALTTLNKTLIAIVNALGANCDGLGGYLEDAGEIATSGNISHEKRDFAFGFNDFGPQETSQNFDWELVIDKEHADNGIFADGYEYSVEVNAWIVAPLGTEMEHLDGALRAFFSEEAYKAARENNCLADYPGVCGAIPLRYPLKSDSPGGVMGLNASNDTTLFIDPEDDDVICRTERNKITGIEYEVCEPKKKRVVLTLIETRHAPGIWGAQIGWLVRKIEETVRPLDIQIECSRTEDLFLGKCQIKQLGASGSAGQPVPSSLLTCNMELGYSSSIEQTVVANKQAYLAEIKKTFPNTQMDSAMYDYVIKYSRENGWNPALILALGREETAWGAVGAPHWLGCMAGDPGSISDPILHAKQQMDCVFLNFTSTMSCMHFICRYSEGTDGDSCVFAINPKFPERIFYYYNAITTPGYLGGGP